MLLDDFEPGMTTARLQPLLGELVDELVPLVADVASALRSSGAAADRLRIELTESAMQQEHADAEPVLRELHDLGLPIDLSFGMRKLMIDGI